MPEKQKKPLNWENLLLQTSPRSISIERLTFNLNQFLCTKTRPV